MSVPMFDRPQETCTHVPRPENDGSTTSPLTLFVPLRLRSESGSEIVEIDQPSAVLGRHTDADVRLLAPDVSRRHCRLFFTAGVWHAEDMASLNGLAVNGQRVRTSPLFLGDRLRIGATTFIVERAAVPRGIKGRGGKNETLRSIADVIAK